ncbi:MAG: hypothetical protein IPL81_05735 [Flavobacteriales bacterium]|nr:hypothetical protein [Flavobacteriales bacterium]
MPQRIIVASGIEIRDAPQEADLVGMLNAGTTKLGLASWSQMDIPAWPGSCSEV